MGTKRPPAQVCARGENAGRWHGLTPATPMWKQPDQRQKRKIRCTKYQESSEASRSIWRRRVPHRVLLDPRLSTWPVVTLEDPTGVRQGHVILPEHSTQVLKVEVHKPTFAGEAGHLHRLPGASLVRSSNSPFAQKTSSSS